MKILDVEMEIDDFAEFMFLKNVSNIPLEISMGLIESNKDLYCFCLDLFCKGLVLMFSKDSKSVLVEELSFNDFECVKRKMACAGINVNLDVVPMSPQDFSSANLTNLKDLDSLGENEPLEQYKFILNTVPYKYIVSFSLFHNV